MGEYRNNCKDKVISLKDRRLRKKHKRFFDFLNKISGIFHKDTKRKPEGKQSYKRTVNH